MQKIELTSEMISWLKINYGPMSRTECSKHFLVSPATIDRWAKQLSLVYQRPVKKQKKVVAVIEEDISEEEVMGYCMDCKYYVAGGHCGKKGRYTGALNEKQCFKGCR